MEEAAPADGRPPELQGTSNVELQQQRDAGECCPSEVLVALSRSSFAVVEQKHEEDEPPAASKKKRKEQQHEEYVGELPDTHDDDTNNAAGSTHDENRERKKYRLSTAATEGGAVALHLEVRHRDETWKAEKVVPDLAKTLDVRTSLTVCEQLGLSTSAKDHGHLGGLLAGKIGVNRFVAQYAVDGRAKCRHVKCEHPAINCGELRIGKIPPSIKTKHSQRTHWYHLPCIFRSFKCVCKGTKVITSPNDIEAFDQLNDYDKDKIKAYVYSANAAAHFTGSTADDGCNHVVTPNSEAENAALEHDALPTFANSTALVAPPASFGEELDGIVGLALLGKNNNRVVESTSA